MYYEGTKEMASKKGFLYLDEKEKSKEQRVRNKDKRAT